MKMITNSLRGMIFSSALALTITIFAFPQVASAADDGSVKAGSDKARACQVCHGKGGRSTNPTYPRLAGQHAKYIVKQLKAFKAGIRKDPIMNGMAATLDEQDMKDVAAYFESNG